VIEDYLGQGPKQRRDRWSSLVQQRLVVVDDFKAYNDAYGHQEGDYVLRKVALAIVAALRVEDVASRYGGEEFDAHPRLKHPEGYQDPDSPSDQRFSRTQRCSSHP
jgi:hypothetical protein